MPFKFDANGAVVLADSNGVKLPVFVYADGKEAPFDADSAVTKISGLNREAQTHREAKEAAEAKLRAFAGIEDPAKAMKALETMANIDDSKLFSAGKVEEIKSAAARAAEERVAAATRTLSEELLAAKAERDGLKGALDAHIIGGGFAKSKLITDDKHPTRLNLPPDVAESFFGKHFKVEDGQAVGYDSQGQKIFSRTKPGEVASFDEALETLVDRYPNKASILKGSGASGGGATGGGGAAGGRKTITREQFDRMDPNTQRAELKAGATLTD